MNLGQQLDLSIILVNWNSLELTSAALESIREHTKNISYEVFVIDNGTTKDAGVKDLPARFPWIKFIANAENLGFSKANNQGIRASRGRYVLLLNNDTEQIENALGESVSYMDAHPKIGALGILHLNKDTEHTIQASHFNFPRPLQETLGLVGLNIGSASMPHNAASEKEVDWIVGSYLFMRRECLEQVGELDERFFIYDEDIDWCYRAHKTGWKIHFWSRVAMVHVGAAARPFMKDKTFIHFRSHLSYINKHHTFVIAALYYLAMSVHLSLATGKQVLRCFTGQASITDLRERFKRQIQFLTLQSGKAGG